MQNFAQHLIRSAWHGFFLWAVFVGVIFAFYPFDQLNGKTIAASAAVLTALFALYVIVVLLLLICAVRRFAQLALPKILTTIGDDHILLLSPSELFVYGTRVSIFLLEDTSYEKLLGFGVILNIQSDKKIQIKVLLRRIGSEEAWRRIFNNDTHMLKKLILKPNIAHDYDASQFVDD